MKTCLLFLFTAVIIFYACNDDQRKDMLLNPEPETSIISLTADSFFPPENDGSRRLEGGHAAKFMYVLDSILDDPALRCGITKTKITDDQYKEIAGFTATLVKGLTSQQDQYNAIFNWVVKNIRYENSSNAPYDVFKNKKGVCQGYANLLKIMALTQNIPTLVVNGQLGTLGAHAWNYSYLDGNLWVVGDPTNNNKYLMKKEISLYGNSLIPYFTDITVAEDDSFVYGYDYGISISEIKANREEITVPFSLAGYQIESFYLKAPLPGMVKVLWVGSNIRNLGENAFGLKRYKGNLMDVFISLNNEVFEDYGGVVYRKGENIPYYIPDKKEIIKLKLIETVGKNVIVNHSSVKDIWFAPGTKTIENYALEICPVLERIYIPSSVTTIAPNAFYDVNNAKLIRY